MDYLCGQSDGGHPGPGAGKSLALRTYQWEPSRPRHQRGNGRGAEVSVTMVVGTIVAWNFNGHLFPGGEPFRRRGRGTLRRRASGTHHHGGPCLREVVVPNDILLWFPSLSRLIWVTAYCLRWLPGSNRVGDLSREKPTANWDGSGTTTGFPGGIPPRKGLSARA